MKQEGLIECVIEALELYVGAVNGEATPAEANSFMKDTDEEVAHSDFSCHSVVGMLLYLSGHSQPDVAYAVNFTPCNMFSLRNFHELELKRIVRYL